jgi:hypothetical protein
MDGFVRGHLAADGTANGPLTMGYYTREDLRFAMCPEPRGIA